MIHLQLIVQVIVVTQARVLCLICTHEPEGPQRLRVSVYISGKARVPDISSYTSL